MEETINQVAKQGKASRVGRAKKDDADEQSEEEKHQAELARRRERYHQKKIEKAEQEAKREAEEKQETQRTIWRQRKATQRAQKKPPSQNDKNGSAQNPAPCAGSMSPSANTGGNDSFPTRTPGSVGGTQR